MASGTVLPAMCPFDPPMLDHPLAARRQAIPMRPGDVLGAATSNGTRQGGRKVSHEGA